MARKYGRLMCAVWDDKDYQALSLADQGMFAGLLAYPKISYVGVIDWMPSRLIKISHGLTKAQLTEHVSKLLEAGFLCFDQETEELLIRRFMYWDGVLTVKNMGKAMVSAYNDVESDYLREIIIGELGRIWNENSKLQGWSGVTEMASALMDEIVSGATC